MNDKNRSVFCINEQANPSLGMGDCGQLTCQMWHVRESCMIGYYTMALYSGLQCAVVRNGIVAYRCDVKCGVGQINVVTFAKKCAVYKSIYLLTYSLT